MSNPVLKTSDLFGIPVYNQTLPILYDESGQGAVDLPYEIPFI
jgi:hypothetical protein